MNDDWRLHVTLSEPGHVAALAEHLDATTLEHELETEFRDRVIVSTDGRELFCYTGSRPQAEAAERLLRRLALENDYDIECRLSRWHPEAQAWEDPDDPLPTTELEVAAERAQRAERGRAEAEAQGFPDFEVRLQCRTDEECTRLAGQLEAEGLPVVRRGRYLVIGAADEASAQALARRCREEAPDGTTVLAEGTAPAVLNSSPMNPFALFGGLGT